MSWLRRLTAGRAHRIVPVAEVMEPRILYSADLAAGLALGTPLAGLAETRTLTAGGEYSATPQPASTVSVTTAYVAPR
jgi:hypothetical protein